MNDPGTRRLLRSIQAGFWLLALLPMGHGEPCRISVPLAGCFAETFYLL